MEFERRETDQKPEASGVFPERKSRSGLWLELDHGFGTKFRLDFFLEFLVLELRIWTD